MRVEKTADVATISQAGDVINYDYTVENVGNVSLTDVVVNDDLLGPIALVGLTDEDGDGDADDLAVGATATGQAQFVADQADIDAANDVVNIAVADSDESAPATATVAVSVAQHPDLLVEKTANVATVDAAGDQIVYSYRVENTGNTTLTNVSLDDDLLGAISLGGLTDEDGDFDLDDLAPGAVAFGQKTITVTQADIDSGLDIVNIATGGSDQTGDETATAAVSVSQNPEIEVQKIASVSVATRAGEQIDYGFTVRNLGNVTLTDVVLDDDQVGPVALVGLTDEDGDGALDDLAVGATATGSATIVISPAQVAAGQPIVNVATADANESDPKTATQAVTVDVPEVCCGIVAKDVPPQFAATQTGTAGQDSLNGANAASVIFGLGGDDTLSGNEGQNVLVGGFGNDIKNGGNESDDMFGQAGDDILNGNNGDNYLDGGIGDDKLYGAGGNDDILGGAGDDLVEGGDGEDRICGGAGNDIIQGEGGDDCIGGGQDDGVIAAGGPGGVFNVTLGDQLYGNGGADTFEYRIGDGVDLLFDFNGADGDVLEIQGHDVADAQFVKGSTVYGTFAGIVFDNGGELEGVFFQQLQSEQQVQDLIGSGFIDFV